ncbi:hypothetical protein [Synechococcus sp. PCC 7336]|uniref:hypothetical protein n=1 Tax=Synechococcus sp. PCC 7336 TaxID=195250 RepID=UPI00034AE535|nr:hypothetical protein [Synechococcus sp. PCC 7336]
MRARLVKWLLYSVVTGVTVFILFVGLASFFLHQQSTLRIFPHVTRILEFPLEASVGEVYAFDPNPPNFSSRPSRIFLNDAVGTQELSFPEGWFLELIINDNASHDLSFLRTLDADLIATISLSGTSVRDESLSNLSHLVDLQVIKLDTTPITGAGLIYFSDLPKLIFISLYNSQIQDSELIHLESLPGLRFLYLNNTDISDLGLTHVGKLTKLERLGLRNTDISDRGIAELQNLLELRDLDLGSTNFSDEGIIYLQNMTKLHTLTVDSASISESGREQIELLPSLILLRLR